MNVPGPVFAGVLATAMLALGLALGGARGPDSVVRGAAGDAELFRAIADLRATIDRLALALDLGTPGGAGRTVPDADGAAPGSSTIPALAESPERRPVHPAPRLLERPKDERHLGELQPHAIEGREVEWRYLFRSYSEILEEFGRPDDVRPDDGGVRFDYTYPDRQGDGHILSFLFIDGVVVNVYN